MDINSTDLFELINEWAVALPNGHENTSEPSSDTFSKLGNEIKQRLSELNRPTLDSTRENSEYVDKVVVKKEEGAEKEVDLKPPFVFELKSDNTANDKAFECVYDFCTALETFCRSTSTSSQRLDIEKDWHKLLLACSSHNYERFMWIHLTFQSTLRLKLRWKQVVTRLMSKFDAPERRILVQELLSSFRYIPELATATTNSIYMVNSDFCRYADELGDNPVKIIDYYVDGMPPSIKQVIKSTMQYDEFSHFKYTLLDIQQRATVFTTTKEDKFIFYSKSAHLAISLEHEMVNNKDCEFHLLAEHATSNCPDYIIVKYPYMDFMPLVVDTTKNNNVTRSLPPPKSNVEKVTTNTVPNSHPTDAPMANIKSIVPEPKLSSVKENQQKSVSVQPAVNLPVDQTVAKVSTPEIHSTKFQISEQRPIASEALEITETIQDQGKKYPSKEISQTVPAQKTSVAQDRSKVSYQVQTTITTASQPHTTGTWLTQRKETSDNPPVPQAQDIADAMLKLQAQAQSQVHISSQVKSIQLT
jgi:hypothetical protein